MNRLFVVLLVLSVLSGLLLFILSRDIGTLPQPVAAPSETAAEPDSDVGAEAANESPAARSLVSPATSSQSGESAPEGESPNVPANLAPADSPPAAGSEAASTPIQLLIQSLPVSGEVWVDGVQLGRAPLKIPLKDEVQVVEIRAEGYQDFTKVAPRKSESTIDVSWKVVLDPAPSAKKSADKKPAKKLPPPQAINQNISRDLPPMKPPVALIPVTSTKGSAWYIQVKAISLEGSDSSGEFSSALAAQYQVPVQVCRVDLGERGRWARVLIGPATNRDEALRLRERIKGSEFYADSFVVGENACQK